MGEARVINISTSFSQTSNFLLMLPIDQTQLRNIVYSLMHCINISLQGHEDEKRRGEGRTEEAHEEYPGKTICFYLLIHFLDLVCSQMLYH